MGQPTGTDAGPDGEPAAPVAARRGRVRWQGRPPPAVQGLLALLLYLAAWAGTETYPLLRHPQRPQLAQGGYDPNFYVWALHWLPYAVGHGLDPLSTTRIGAPSGYSLAWVTTVPPLGLLAAPVTLTAGPVAAFSLLVVAAVPVSGWGAFILCRRLTGRFWAALAGGAVYGFSAFEINHSYTGQLNLSFSVLLPLTAYLMVAWRDGALSARWFVAATALALAVQAYLFLETFADLTVVLVAGFAVGAALAGPAGLPLLGRLARLTALAYLIALVLAAPYAGYALTHRLPGFTRDTAPTSIALGSLVVPLHGHDLGLSWLSAAATRLGGVPSRDGYLGIPLILLALALPLAARGSRLARFLLALTGLVIVGALGPVLRLDNVTALVHLPWSGLWSLPVVTSAYPSRLMVFAFLALAAGVALWLSLPGRWGSSAAWARWLLAAAALAALGGNVNRLDYAVPPGLPAFITTGEYRAYLPQDAVVVVLSQRGNAGLLWQAATGSYFRLAGGYVNEAISADGGLPAPVARLLPPPGRPPAPAAVAAFARYLAASQVSDILVEGSGHSGRWPSVLGQAGLAGIPAGGVTVYPVGAVAASGRLPG